MKNNNQGFIKLGTSVENTPHGNSYDATEENTQFSDHMTYNEPKPPEVKPEEDKKEEE